MTINAQAIRAVADHIEQHPDQYDQHEIYSVRGCCIAGRALLNANISPITLKWWEQARNLLGLSKYQAQFLFWDEWLPAESTTVPEALRRFADGEKLSEVSADPGDDQLPGRYPTLRAWEDRWC